jgi:hypothetical protein
MAEPTWLSYADAAKLSDIADEVMDGSDADEAWAGAVDAAAEWVEDKRPDATYTDGTTAGPRLRLGCARLALRWFYRRTSPLGATRGFADFAGSVVLEDPDLASMLGVGSKGRFVFGAARPIPEVTP